MGRVIACGIPQGAGQKDGGIPARAGQKAAEGDEPAEYRREQDTKKARRKRPSRIPQETGLKAAEGDETAEYRREQD